MDTHCGSILLKSVRLNIQPAISRKLIINTIAREIHIINLSELDILNNCRFSTGMCSEELPDIAS
jgi:hypothetical protein